MKLSIQPHGLEMPLQPITDTEMVELLRARDRADGKAVDWFNEDGQFEEYEDMLNTGFPTGRFFWLTMRGTDVLLCVAALRWIPDAMRRIARLEREVARLKKQQSVAGSAGPKR